jgi:hypothetical protein
MRPTPPKPKFLQPWSARRWRLLVSSNFRNDSYIRDLSDTCRRLTLDRLYQRRASAQTPPIFCAQATERTFVLGICPAPLFALYGQQIKPGGFCFHGQHAMTRTRFVKSALRRCVADWRGVVPSVTLLASSHGSIPSFSTCAQKLCLLAILADPSEVPGYP